MVNPVALVAFFIFSLEVTPFYAILVLGSGNTLKYVSLLVLCLYLTLRQSKLSVNTLTVLLLGIAFNEIALNLLHGSVSLNGSRILISIMIFSLLINKANAVAQFVKLLAIFHKFTVYGFIFSVALVAVFGETVLHVPLPFVDDSIHNKVSYWGDLKLEAVLVFNFNTYATPDFNIAGLTVLPSGLSSEPHAFFSYVLVSTAILHMSGYLSRRLSVASMVTLALCLSYSNLLALVLAGLSLAILMIIRQLGLKSAQHLITFLVIGSIYYVSYEYLKTDNIVLIDSNLDRSYAQSFAIIARMMAMDFGWYSLEDIPTYFNDYKILPLSITSFLLFMGFMMYLVSRLDVSLGRLRCFALMYLIFYAGKSLGVTIFLPYSILTLLFLTTRKI